MDKLFWGRAEVTFTHAHFHFQKNATSQKVLFNLKYKQNSEIGVRFGQRIGKELLDHPKLVDVDYLIPVPLHPKKQFIRGYNQSEAIANGISTTSHLIVNTTLIKRVAHTESQTKKSRFERWDNVEKAFLVNPSISKAKHVVLVDDVITTGSTIEQLIQLIRTINPEIKVSVVTLAIA
jgi:ComF family protein